MDAAELAFAGAVRQAALVRTGEVTARELVELYLDRIDRLDPDLNAFRIVHRERALAEAEQADSRRGAGEERPLLGVAIAVKDDQDVAGEVTARGTDAYGPPAAQDAEIVRRLREAGAVIVGKTNVPELEIMGETESPTWGVTRNPWDVERSPGGSSGGSAVAVAAGLCAAATASDGAGSIRIPAASCGVFGLKPQRGRITLSPRREVWHGLDVYGFLTRSVADSALLLDVAAGAAPRDPQPPPPPSDAYADAAAREPGRLRIALSTRPAFPSVLDRRVRAALDETVDLLRSLGHTVERSELAYGMASSATTVRYLRGISDDARAMARPQRLQRRTRGFKRLGELIPDSLLARARREEARNAERLGRVLELHDVILMPTTARPPVGAAQWEGLGALRTLLGMATAYPYCATWNQTGQPAAAVPAGFTSDALPLSVQLVGPPNGEPMLISLASQLESARPWTSRRPPVGA